MKIKKEFLVGLWIIGIWSFILCVWSWRFGPVGDSPGLKIGGYIIIPAMSRYGDPLVLGIVGMLAMWMYKHLPPWKYPPEIMDEDGETNMLQAIALFGVAYAMYGILPTIQSQATNVLINMVVTLALVPVLSLGLLTVMVAIVSVFMFVYYGPLTVASAIILIFTAKHAIWWIVNIIRYGWPATKKVATDAMSPSIIEED